MGRWRGRPGRHRRRRRPPPVRHLRHRLRVPVRLGLLHDDGGDDRYTSDSYSVRAPHFAVGIVIDESGDDVARSILPACGFGRDFSLGWFEEGGGDDVYLYSDSAFGVGNERTRRLLGQGRRRRCGAPRATRSASRTSRVGDDAICRSTPACSSTRTVATATFQAAGRRQHLGPRSGRPLRKLASVEFVRDGCHHWRDHLRRRGRPAPRSTPAPISPDHPDARSRQVEDLVERLHRLVGIDSVEILEVSPHRGLPPALVARRPFRGGRVPVRRLDIADQQSVVPQEERVVGPTTYGREPSISGQTSS